MGDSTTNNAEWCRLLFTNLTAHTREGLPVLGLYEFGVNYQTVKLAVQNSLPNVVAMEPNNPVTVVCLSWGKNAWKDDSWALLTQESWTADYLTIIDTIIGKWPQVRIFLTRPWSRGRGERVTIIADWIAAIVSLRPANCFLGDDERIWLEGGDDGVTNSTDGTHFRPEAQIKAALAKQAAIG